MTDKDEKGEPESKYRLIQVAAKRARQLQGGARAQMDVDSTKATKVAMEEVKAGKIEWTVTEKRKAADNAPSEEPKTEAATDTKPETGE
jgi:DNA-directed RNA polymerase subunit omega